MDRQEIREGMHVYGSDGEKLGKIVRCDADSFVIEKGFFFPKDTVARYDQVAGVDGDDVRLATTGSALGLGEGASGERGEAREMQSGMGMGTTGVTEQTTIPVVEEELLAEKRERQAGEVRVRKEVRTEHKQVTVPVTREEVHVERVPVNRGEATGDEARFDEGTVSIPVREEEVEIRKRPVVREEVRIGKTARREERRADAEVRREDVKVEKEGDVEYRGGTGGIDDPRDD